MKHLYLGVLVLGGFCGGICDGNATLRDADAEGRFVPPSTMTVATYQPLEYEPIVVEIFKNLDVASLKNAAVVCKLWRNASQNDEVWQHVLEPFGLAEPSQAGVSHRERLQYLLSPELVQAILPERFLPECRNKKSRRKEQCTDQLVSKVLQLARLGYKHAIKFAVDLYVSAPSKQYNPNSYDQAGQLFEAIFVDRKPRTMDLYAEYFYVWLEHLPEQQERHAFIEKHLPLGGPFPEGVRAEAWDAKLFALQDEHNTYGYSPSEEKYQQLLDAILAPGSLYPMKNKRQALSLRAFDISRKALQEADWLSMLESEHQSRRLQRTFLYPYLMGPHLELRLQAMSLLSEFQRHHWSDEYIEWLRTLLADADPQMRVMAFEELRHLYGMASEDEKLQALNEQGLSSLYPDLKVTAELYHISQLCRRNQFEAAYNFAQQMLSQNYGADVRLEVLKMIYKIHHGAASQFVKLPQPLVGFLQSCVQSEDEAVRLWAYTSIYALYQKNDQSQSREKNRSRLSHSSGGLFPDTAEQWLEQALKTQKGDTLQWAIATHMRALLKDPKRADKGWDDYIAFVKGAKAQIL